MQIRRHEEQTSTEHAQTTPAKQKVATLAFWSIIVSFGVMGLKFVAWKMTGSVALYSDALESIVNVIAAGAAFWAIRVSHKPADQGHPFGHHKAEYFSAVLEGVLIGIAAVLIIMAVARNWAAPPMVDQPWPGIAVNGLAAAINAVWALTLIRVGGSQKSPALVADDLAWPTGEADAKPSRRSAVSARTPGGSMGASARPASRPEP